MCFCGSVILQQCDATTVWLGVPEQQTAQQQYGCESAFLKPDERVASGSGGATQAPKSSELEQTHQARAE